MLGDGLSDWRSAPVGERQVVSGNSGALQMVAATKRESPLLSWLVIALWPWGAAADDTVRFMEPPVPIRVTVVSKPAKSVAVGDTIQSEIVLSSDEAIQGVSVSFLLDWHLEPAARVLGGSVFVNGVAMEPAGPTWWVVDIRPENDIRMTTIVEVERPGELALEFSYGYVPTPGVVASASNTVCRSEVVPRIAETLR